MLPYRDSKPTRIALVMLFLIIIGYAYFEAQGLLYGPTINIADSSATVTHEQYVLIQGQADHLTALSVDGEPISLTEAGAFQKPLVLAPGVNRIVFDAKDKYGHSTQKVIEMVYEAPAPSTIIPTGTSSDMRRYPSSLGLGNSLDSTI